VDAISFVQTVFSFLPAPWVWAGAFLFYFTWIGYLALCTLKRANDAGLLRPEVKAVAYPALGAFLVLDTAFNWTLGWFLLLDVPREFLLTSHLKSIKSTYAKDHWKYKLADYWCTNWLNWGDPSGAHC
jgi:hypothetical protein